MLRFVLAAALMAAAPAAAQAQALALRPSALNATLRSATPAQLEQVAACMQAQEARCGRPPCGPGTAAQVTQCTAPYGACLANVKRTCVQTVMAPAAPASR